MHRINNNSQQQFASIENPNTCVWTYSIVLHTNYQL